MKKYTVHKNNVIQSLKALSDYEFQKIAWFDNDQGLMYSFADNISDLFDDFYLENALYDDVIIFSKEADEALRDLNRAVEKILGNTYTEEELIDLPLMEEIRQKAARVLTLVKASDSSESTVEIVE